MLEVERPCFNEFPDQCAGCPEYRETRQDQTRQFAYFTGLGMLYPPYIEKIIKECKRYHKRKVEYLR